MSVSKIISTISVERPLEASKQSLPDKTLSHVFRFLSPKDTHRVSTVCLQWQRILSQPKAPSLKQSLLYSKRPKEVQDKIDVVYRSLNKRSQGWLYNGAGGFYNHLGFKDSNVIAQRIAQASAKKKDLYFVDLGAGFFRWVNDTRDFLRSNYKMSAHHFHVIGVTGEGYPHDEIEVNGNVTTHKISGFKLENLLESFPKFNLDLVDSVEFVASFWTLQHLVDPLGTLEQAYHLLTPGNGFLFGTGFQSSMLNVNLMKTFGMFNYITRRSGDSPQTEFILFRDKDYHFSSGLRNFCYNYNQPIIDLPEWGYDSHAQCYAQLNYKFDPVDLADPIGGRFQGTGTCVLEKLLGKDPKWIQYGSKIYKAPLFDVSYGLVHLKNYLDAPLCGDYYEVDIPKRHPESF